jgi:hypothetical protein
MKKLVYQGKNYKLVKIPRFMRWMNTCKMCSFHNDGATDLMDCGNIVGSGCCSPFYDEYDEYYGFWKEV